MRTWFVLKRCLMLCGVVIVLLGITACSTEYHFPDDSGFHQERKEMFGTENQELSLQNDFDFFVQATSYMAGFVSAEGSVYPQVLSAASRSANEWSGGKSYYRFDVKNHDADNTLQPYNISQATFEQFALARPEFYSVRWYFTQEGRRMNLFKEYYESILDSNPDGIYDAVYRNESGGYLYQTLGQLNQNNVSVIFTDFVDTDFEADKTMDWLSAYVADDSDNAVSIIALKSMFNGYVYTGHTAHVYQNGERPLYVLAIGPSNDIERYTTALQAALTAQNISHNALLLSGRKTGDPIVNFVGENAFTADNVSTPYDGMPMSSSLLRRLSRENRQGLDATTIQLLEYTDTLCFQVVKSSAENQLAEIDFMIPYRGAAGWSISSAEALDIEVELKFSDFDDDGKYAWRNGGLNADRLNQNASDSARILYAPNEEMIRVTLKLDLVAMLANAPNDSGYRCRISMKLKNNMAMQAPGWIQGYIYDGAYTTIDADNMDAFGATTIMSVSGGIERLLQTTNNRAKDNDLIADLLIYMLYE